MTDTPASTVLDGIKSVTEGVTTYSSTRGWTDIT